MQIFELSVALKYLTPRWRQLSVSIISLISILVIALVVWLIVVFFSVTHGLEKNWVQKLIALTAPIRATPTEHYYNSYYYQIDSISADADYSHKTITEKKIALNSDPYDPMTDEEIPDYWPPPILDDKGSLVDPVKRAFGIIAAIPEVTGHEYEMTFGTLRLRLLRDIPRGYAHGKGYGNIQNQSFMNQNIYLGSFDPTNKTLAAALVPLNSHDITNMLNTLTLAPESSQQDNPESIVRLDDDAAAEKIRRFFAAIEITKLKTPAHGWALPPELLPDACTLEACVVMDKDIPGKVFLPKERNNPAALKKELQNLGAVPLPSLLEVSEENMHIAVNGVKYPVTAQTPLILEGGAPLSAALVKDTLAHASRDADIGFEVSVPIQGIEVTGVVPYSGLEVAEVNLPSSYPNTETAHPLWIYAVKEGDGDPVYTLPADSDIGDGVLLPKTFRDGGVLVGDRGYLSYVTPTASSMQEQRVPIMVAGFYDPGIVPLGGKFVMASQEVTSLIRSLQNQDDTVLSNGINIRFDDLSKADALKQKLADAFEKAGIADFWNIETYKEFEFTKDILQQLHSEKNLFSLLAVVIIIVACSNIISMLIILVNDKKQEIGILRSMGASSFSIAMIFGTCGVVMGLIGSAIGIVLAFLTLQNLQSLVGLLSSIQGHEMFNPAFYGETLPTDLSFEALVFVIMMTAAISTLAGIVPAIKACMMRPSEILRDE